MSKNPICHSCAKRNTCDFAKDLDRALNGLGSMVSGDTRAQIKALVSKDLAHCDDHVPMRNDVGASEEETSEKTKYFVTYRVDARYRAEVDAENAEEAIAAGNAAFSAANFGEAEDIDGYAVNVQDARGNFVWEKQ